MKKEGLESGLEGADFSAQPELVSWESDNVRPMSRESLLGQPVRHEVTPRLPIQLPKTEPGLRELFSLH